MRILFITSDLDGGGIERVLYNYCKCLNNSILFDFAITSSEEGILEKKILSLGCNIYRIPRIRDNRKKRAIILKELIDSNNYDIVHDNSGYKAFFSLRIAKKCKVPVRIAHAHTACVPESKKSMIIRRLMTVLTKHYATSLFACGELSARWMWGSITGKTNGVIIIKNAIDAERFTFSENLRMLLREKYGLKDKMVIGNVARFSHEKNHDFLIDVFNEIYKNDKNARLVLIGTGELESKIKEKARNLRIDKVMLFMGLRNDVSELYNLFDIFVLPSLHEGVPVTCIEAQANGLSLYLADSITKEIKCNNNVHYLSLNETPKYWADFIQGHNHNRATVVIDDFPFEIQNAAKDLLNVYKHLLHEA